MDEVGKGIEEEREGRAGPEEEDGKEDTPSVGEETVLPVDIRLDEILDGGEVIRTRGTPTRQRLQNNMTGSRLKLRSGRNGSWRLSFSQ